MVKLLSKITLVLVVVLSLGIGCDPTGGGGIENPIKEVVFNPSQDLSTLQLALVFNDNIRVKYSNSYKISNKGIDFGNVFIKKYEDALNPFQAGINFRTAVLQEVDWPGMVKVTDVLPNGMSTQVPVSLLEISSREPISPSYNMYGYVDLINRAWVGGAISFFLEESTSLPEGLTITQVFKRDKKGNPTVILHVYGVKVNGVAQSAIAAFVNVKALIDDSKLIGRKEIRIAPEEQAVLRGPKANEYLENPERIIDLQTRVMNGLSNL